jgi:O-antigen ligase
MKNSTGNVVSESKILNYIKGPDICQKLWRQGILFYILDNIFNIPAKLLKKLSAKTESVIESSFFMKLGKYVTDRMYLVIGLLLVFNMIIPDHLWHNVYGVMMVAALCMIFIFKLLVDKDTFIDIANVDYASVLFFFSIFLAAVTSLFPGESLNYLIYYFISFIFMIILVSSINSLEGLTILIKLVVLGTVFTALYGVYQWKVIGIAVDPSLVDLSISGDLGGRVYSTMGNSNVYGELLVLTAPFLGAIVVNEKSWPKRIFWGAMLLPIMLILLKTGSRSAWGACAAAAFVFVLLWNKKLLPLFFLLGAIAVPLLPSSIYNRILTVFKDTDSSMSYRQKIFACAVSMLRDFWTTGVGLGTKVFITVFEKYKAFGLTRVAHTHNFYLQLWLEAGICAIATFMLTILRLIRNTYAALRRKLRPEATNILISALSAVIGVLVIAFVDHIWFYNRILFMTWAVFAIALAAIKLINKQAAEQ